MSEEQKEAELAEVQLSRIEEYARDALNRQNHLEAVIGGVNADLLKLRVRYQQGLDHALAGESFSLDA